MEISFKQQDGEWYNSLPHNGGVYDLIYMAVSGTGTADRLRAVVALGKSGDPRAVRPLVDLLGDTDNEIRLSATTALGSLKSVFVFANKNITPHAPPVEPRLLKHAPRSSERLACFDTIVCKPELGRP